MHRIYSKSTASAQQFINKQHSGTVAKYQTNKWKVKDCRFNAHLAHSKQHCANCKPTDRSGQLSFLPQMERKCVVTHIVNGEGLDKLSRTAVI